MWSAGGSCPQRRSSATVHSILPRRLMRTVRRRVRSARLGSSAVRTSVLHPQRVVDHHHTRPRALAFGNGQIGRHLAARRADSELSQRAPHGQQGSAYRCASARPECRSPRWSPLRASEPRASLHAGRAPARTKGPGRQSDRRMDPMGNPHDWPRRAPPRRATHRSRAATTAHSGRSEHTTTRTRSTPRTRLRSARAQLARGRPPVSLSLATAQRPYQASNNRTPGPYAMRATSTLRERASRVRGRLADADEMPVASQYEVAARGRG